MALEVPVWIQKGSYAAVQDRTWTTTLVSDGVSDGRADPVALLPFSTDLKCGPNASSLAVDVQPGVCVITGTDAVRQGRYVCRSTAVQTVPLAARPAAGTTRIDRIYAQVQDTAAGFAGGSDTWTITVAQGTPASSNPTLPTLPTSTLELGRVTVQPGAAATLAASEVADVRHRATSLTSPLQKQWQQAAQVSTGQDSFTTGGFRQLLGAIVYFTTYTPNVPFLFSASVDAQAVVNTIGFGNPLIGPSGSGGNPAVYTPPWNLGLFFLGQTRSTFTATWSGVIPNPGAWLALFQGQSTNNPITTNPGSAGNSGVSISWYDVVSATG